MPMTRISSSKLQTRTTKEAQASFFVSEPIFSNQSSPSIPKTCPVSTCTKSSSFYKLKEYWNHQKAHSPQE